MPSQRRGATVAIDAPDGSTLKVGARYRVYPSRRVILHVTVKDPQGNVVFESGKINADGSVVGMDADTNPASFEPHYELITQSDNYDM